MPYAWFCSAQSAPLQSVFLILIYLRHNRDSDNAHLALYFVDEVVEFFTSEESPYSSAVGKQIQGASGPNVTSKQTTTAWTVLRAFRAKLDLPFEIDQKLSEPAIPRRCLNPMSLSPPISHADKVSSTRSVTVAVPTTSYADQDFSANTPVSTTLNIPRPGNYIGYCADSGADMLLDILDLDTWSSSLAQDADNLLSFRLDEQGRANETALDEVSASRKTPALAPANLEGSLDYFDGWLHGNEVSKGANNVEVRSEGVLPVEKRVARATNGGVINKGYGDDDGGRSGSRDNNNGYSINGSGSHLLTVSGGQATNLTESMMSENLWLE